MFFNGYKSNGKLLSREEILEDVPKHLKSGDKESTWTFITQMDHPVLSIPFFCVHPCQTCKIMSDILGESKCFSIKDEAPFYLLTWLSWISSLFELKITSLFLK